MFLLISLVSISAADEKKKVFTAGVDSDGIQRIEVLAGEYFFDPNYVIVKVNIPVELKVRKEPSIVPHDFVINAAEAGLEALEKLSAKPKVIKFTPKKTGKYPFYCGKKLIFSKSHREKGMEGTIEVTE